MLRHKSSSSSSSSSSSGTRHCCHSSRGRSTLPHVLSIPRTPGVHPQVAAAATAADGDSGTDIALQSLREAFGAAPVPPGSAQHMHADEPAPPPVVPAGRRAAGSSSNSRGSGRRPSSAQQQSATSAPQGAAASEPKKRRGRFGDLINAIEHELLHPEQASTSSKKPSTISNSSSSSSSSSSSDSSRSSRGAAEVHAAEPPPLASPTAAAAAAARSPVRRIRRGSAASQQQQQSPSSASSTAAAPSSPRSQQPSSTQPAQQQQELPPWLLQQQQESADAAGGGGGSGRRVKVYAPVPKGDLLLPGGPAWSGLRRHVVAAGADPSLPTLDCIVLVEGDRDQEAVGRAVNAPVYVCDGTRVLKEHVRPELTLLTQLGRRLVVLTDPDERGRELRLHLDDTLTPLTPLHHAFVPEQQGTSDTDGPVHAAGNRGIEHVVPVGVQQALAVAAPSWPRDRAVWGLADLQRLGLANAFDAGHEGVVRGPGGAAARRRQLCALLGLGRCSAAQLVTALNRFFSEEQLAAALAQLDDMAPVAAQ